MYMILFKTLFLSDIIDSSIKYILSYNITRVGFNFCSVLQAVAYGSFLYNLS